jgi:hypothetical protein
MAGEAQRIGLNVTASDLSAFDIDEDGVLSAREAQLLEIILAQAVPAVKPAPPEDETGKKDAKSVIFVIVGVIFLFLFVVSVIACRRASKTRDVLQPHPY